MAAPRPILRPGADAGLDGIGGDVRGGRHEVRLGLDAHGAIPALEHVPTPPVTVIELARVRAVQPLHPGAQVRLRRLDQEMEVVVHNAVRETPPPLPEDDLAEQRQVRAPVIVIGEDPGAVVATGIHVVHSSSLFLTRSPRHTSHSRITPRLAPRGLTPHFIPLRKGV
jgi:hypothetical protein